MANQSIDEMLTKLEGSRSYVSQRDSAAAGAIGMFLAIRKGLEHKVEESSRDQIAATLAAGVLGRSE